MIPRRPWHEPRPGPKPAPLFTDHEALVERSFFRPLEHPPVPHLETEADWEAHHQDMLRKVTRVGRGIDERCERGVGHAEAFEQAMVAEGVGLSAPRVEVLEDDEDLGDDLDSSDDELLDDLFERAEHPLVARARKLVELVMHFFDPSDPRARGDESDPLGPTARGLLEVLGGTVQAFGGLPLEPMSAGLQVVQLKRALRGAAHARGGLDFVVGEGLLDCCPALDVLCPLEKLVTDLERELAGARSRMPTS